MKFNLQTTVFILLIIIYINYSLVGYPLLTNDTTCFLPASYEIKYQHSLTNTLYNGGFNNNNKFLFYPPLFPVIMSIFLFVDHVSILFLSINFINISSLVFVGLIIGLFNKNHKSNNTKILYLIACASFLAPNYSRPELLVHLIYYVFIFINLKNLKWRYFFNGILLIICGLISPINAFYLFLIGVILIFYNQEFCVKNILYTLGGASIVATLFFLTYPYDIADLTSTMNSHAANCITNRNDTFTPNLFLKYHVLNPYGSFGIFIMITALVITGNNLAKSSKPLKFVYLCMFFILITSISYFGFKSIYLSYNIYSLVPFALFIIYTYSQSVKNKKHLKFILLLFSTASISFFYTLLTFLIASYHNPITLGKVKEEILPILMNSNKSFAFTPSYWPLFKSPSTKCKYEIYNNNHTAADFILIQQYATGLQTPPSIPGYKIVVNKFDSPYLLFNMLKIYKYKPFYQYALFKKNSYDVAK